MKLSTADKEALLVPQASYCRAGLMEINGPQLLSPASNSRFSENIRREMTNSVSAFQAITSTKAESFPFNALAALPRLFSDTRDPIFWDQALWESVSSADATDLRKLSSALEQAPTLENGISVLLAIAHASSADPTHASEVFESLSEDSVEIELSEWATLLLREMLSIAREDVSIMNAAVSDRDFTYDPSGRFDIVLPLMFTGSAYTQIGPLVKRTVISPLWFYKVFGRANALVRLETVDSDLIVEKRMEGVNPDGSPHFEVFPFSGDTSLLSESLRSHNYWAQLSRPFYTSGRTGIVGRGDHVIKGVPMTFQRAAETMAPERYSVAGGNLIETTRGIFFGQGHIEPSVLLSNRFDVQPGNFQLCSAVNPETERPANTCFYGTFYGKVSDWNGDGKIDFNSLPVHSSVDGQVDYLGDGSLMPTTLRPEDWS